MKLRFEISKRDKEVLKIIKWPATFTIWFCTWAFVAFLSMDFAAPTFLTGLACVLTMGFLIVGVSSLFDMIYRLDLMNVRLYHTYQNRRAELRHMYKKRMKMKRSQRDKKWGTQL